MYRLDHIDGAPKIALRGAFVGDGERAHRELRRVVHVHAVQDRERGEVRIAGVHAVGDVVGSGEVDARLIEPVLACVRAGQLVVDQKRSQRVLPAPGHADDLLVGPPILQRRIHRAVAVGHRRRQEVSGAWRVHPAVAVVLEVGEQPADVKRRAGMAAMVDAAGHTDPRAVVPVLAQVERREDRHRAAADVRDVRARLEVIDAAAVPVVAPAPEHAPLLLRAQTRAARRRELRQAPATDDVGVAAHEAHARERLFAGHLGDQIDRPADRVRILVGG